MLLRIPIALALLHFQHFNAHIDMVPGIHRGLLEHVMGGLIKQRHILVDDRLGPRMRLGHPYQLPVLNYSVALHIYSLPF